MKIKKLNIIMFLFLLLIMVGFSPPYNNLNINNSKLVVYAENLQGTGNTVEYNDTDFVNSVKAYIAKYNLFKDKNGDNKTAMETQLVTNLDASIGRFNKYLDTIVNATKVVMTSLCVLTIAIIGWKYMNSGTGNLIDFIKSKDKLYNTALAMVFVIGIPTLITAINGVSVKVYSGGNNFSNYGELGTGEYILALDTEEGSQKIENVFVTPNSYLMELYNDDFFDENVGFNGVFSNGDEESEDRFLSTGGFLRTIEKFLLFLLEFIYTPFHFIINIIGMIGFYPMSFDPAVYEGDMVAKIVGQFGNLADNKLVQAMFDDPGKLNEQIVSTVAGAFQKVIIVINLIAGILKKVCLGAVDFACYFFGLKVLLGVESTKVKEFLYKLAQGVLGMFAAPLIIQTLIDVDAIISSAILGLAGNSVPGMGMMNLIMAPKDAAYSVINFVFGTAMLAMMVFIVQAFFFRRIELIMYYLAAPAVFLKHIFEPRPTIVMLWLGQVASASFVTTTYAPLFVTVNLLVMLGGSLTGLDLLLYYAIIWFIIYKGKDITLWLTDLFFGGKSFSDTAMRTKMQEGLEYTKNLPGKVLRAPGAIISGAIGGAGAAYGMATGLSDAYNSEKTNGGGFGSLVGKAAVSALVGDKLKAGTEKFSESFSNARENNWYNNHLRNKEATRDALEDAGLDSLSRTEGKDAKADELASRYATVKDRKVDGKNYAASAKEVAKENPNMDTNSDEFRNLVNERYQSKKINLEDKENVAKGKVALGQIFDSNSEEFVKISNNSLLNETIKSDLISKYASSKGYDYAKSEDREKFMNEFNSDFEGKQLAKIEAAKKEYLKAQSDYENELSKPESMRDLNVSLNSLRTMDKNKEIIAQSADLEKLITAKTTTINTEKKINVIEEEIVTASKNIVKTTAEIRETESKIEKLKANNEDYSAEKAHLSKLYDNKATYEANKEMKINTRNNLEQKIDNSRDTARQQEAVITTKTKVIEKNYSTPTNRSTSEKAYRDTVGKETYAKIRTEVIREKVTDSNGKHIIGADGKEVTRPITIKRDASDNIRTDSNGSNIDYSEGTEAYTQHMNDMAELNKGISQVENKTNYDQKPKTSNSKSQGKSQGKSNGSMDKIFKENMNEQFLKGTFHNHNDDNKPMY